MENVDFKKWGLWILGAALIGGFIASWIAPQTIAWYFEPPVNIGINCRPATEWSMQKLKIAQLIGVIGAAATVTAFAIWKERRKT